MGIGVANFENEQQREPESEDSRPIREHDYYASGGWVSIFNSAPKPETAILLSTPFLPPLHSIYSTQTRNQTQIWSQSRKWTYEFFLNLKRVKSKADKK
jgi:hypothetical protein